MNRKERLLVIGVTLAGLALAAFGAYRQVEVTPHLARHISDNPTIGSPFQLVDHNGDPITESAFANAPTAVFFGYTNCPEVCPTTMYDMTEMLKRLGNKGKDIKVFFVTLDPEFDRPEVLKDYIGSFGDRIVGITGSQEGISRLARSWHVYRLRTDYEDGNYSLDHTASVFLVDRNGIFRGTIPYGESGRTAIEKLRELVNT